MSEVSYFMSLIRHEAAVKSWITRRENIRKHKLSERAVKAHRTRKFRNRALRAWITRRQNNN